MHRIFDSTNFFKHQLVLADLISLPLLNTVAKCVPVSKMAVVHVRASYSISLIQKWIAFFPNLADERMSDVWYVCIARLPARESSPRFLASYIGVGPRIRWWYATETDLSVVTRSGIFKFVSVTCVCGFVSTRKKSAEVFQATGIHVNLHYFLWDRDSP